MLSKDRKDVSGLMGQGFVNYIRITSQFGEQFEFWSVIIDLAIPLKNHSHSHKVKVSLSLAFLYENKSR